MNEILEYSGPDPKETEVIVPEGVTTILNKAFGKNKYKKIILPRSLKTICKAAFNNTAIDKLYYNGTLEEWLLITFESSKGNPLLNTLEFYIKTDDSYILASDLVVSSKPLKNSLVGLKLKNLSFSKDINIISKNMLLNCTIQNLYIHSQIKSIQDSIFMENRIQNIYCDCPKNTLELKYMCFKNTDIHFYYKENEKYIEHGGNRIRTVWVNSIEDARKVSYSNLTEYNETSGKYQLFVQGTKKILFIEEHFNSISLNIKEELLQNKLSFVSDDVLIFYKRTLAGMFKYFSTDIISKNSSNCTFEGDTLIKYNGGLDMWPAFPDDPLGAPPKYASLFFEEAPKHISLDAFDGLLNVAIELPINVKDAIEVFDEFIGAKLQQTLVVYCCDGILEFVDVSHKKAPKGLYYSYCTYGQNLGSGEYIEKHDFYMFLDKAYNSFYQIRGQFVSFGYEAMLLGDSDDSFYSILDIDNFNKIELVDYENG